jgi:hypothetical protein
MHLWVKQNSDNNVIFFPIQVKECVLCQISDAKFMTELHIQQFIIYIQEKQITLLGPKCSIESTLCHYLP